MKRMRSLTSSRRLLALLGALLLALLPAGATFADHTDNPQTVTVAGTIQSELGCDGDWQPPCEATFLTYDADNDVWTGTFELTAGTYEYKVAINGSWGENYGLDGAQDGPNIPLVVEADGPVTFTYDHNTHLVTDSTGGGTAAAAAAVPVTQPDTVTIPGTIQSVLGCPGDWAPDCEVTFLTLGEDDAIWTGTFAIPAGEYEYKVALNQSWDVNYGLGAQAGGANIPLSVPVDQDVTFYYDRGTNWVTDDVNSLIPIVIGDFQEELGCAADNDATCLRTWLQNADGDAIYSIVSNGAVPPGDYTAQAVLGQDADNPVGEPVNFTVDEETPIYLEFDSDTNTLTVSTEGAPKGDLGTAAAHWVTADTVAWDIDPAVVATAALHYDANSGLKLDRTTLGGNAISMTVDPAGLSAEILARFPHLAGFTALKLNPDQAREVRIALKGQVAVAAFNEDGVLSGATSLQIPGVIDDLYTYDGPLGVTISDGVPTVAVWAPTARGVRFHLFDDANPETAGTVTPMRIDPNTGVWSITGEPDWINKFYLFEIEVYAPTEKRVVTNLVTDPYAISLAMNSTRSQIIDFNDPALMPDGWLDYEKPALAAPEDITLYELHVRDFSIIDETVRPEYRGTYMAFTESDSNGMAHLRALAEAGLSHIHLLPAFDIATIDEDRSTWDAPGFADLEGFAADAEEQQALVYAARVNDGFNWGYDPFHYNTPEGSYSTDPDGATRVREFRAMVMALNETGLRVVMDVVYNHTNASGQSEKSVLDKVVPGYYHRLSPTGTVERSTCCDNTATEHNMMRKLMVDSVELWATAYKVDGFRFDLMGHHMLSDMIAVRETLNGLTAADDGVDGEAVYVYGEGWNFGEVADNARGVNATQLNVPGTGLGTFSDRLRDAARGGNPFGGFFEQGFINGLYNLPNEHETRDESQQLATLLLFADQIRVGLAGNLADYSFINRDGEEVTGRQVDYNGQPAGYTADPQENIIYVSAHDNETLFDAIQAKAPASAGLDERIRMQNLGLSVVAFAQGVPFFHAGSDMLRSKSFDRDSYDSGDWYNALDFTYQRTGFGIGLPPADKNQERYDDMRPLLGNPDLVPDREHVLRNVTHMREVLAIRAGSPLFRLQTAQEIQARVAFHNTGPDQVPGVIIMSIDDTVGEDLDPDADRIVVFYNATPEEQTISVDDLAGTPLALHPLQVESADEVVRGATYDRRSGSFTVPAWTTAVYVGQGGGSGLGAVDLGLGGWVLTITLSLLGAAGVIAYLVKRRSDARAA